MGDALTELLRVEGGRVLATLIRFTGDIGLAEDALQEATIAALERWPVTGTPRQPGAWLTTAARNKALDRMRRESTRARRELTAVLLDDPAGASGVQDSVVRDDVLRLLFTCCHPALSPEARVALALRTIGGMTTPEIARAFLVPEPTMGQRISRAKRKIAEARIPYRVPDDHELPDRLPAVLAVVFLVFTTGHHAPSGRWDDRVDLAEEGIRLARLLVSLMPDEPECAGLLALVLSTHARRSARVDGRGEPVLMADQDRTRWDHAAIAEAGALVEGSLGRRRPGPYMLQAAISCLHGHAATFADTDWPQIAFFYGVLEQLQPTTVVRVNRAVAVAFAQDAEAGLALLDDLRADDVANWHLYWSTRAELLLRSDRAGRRADAEAAFTTALGCPCNDDDRRFLERRLAAIG